ncbi:hypothetical protein C8R43DRAFT_1123109 [Mycena crocata]|nr:hypothetical protein C8R43DRAFT_1123109 [Mycena crocata]
MLPTGTSCRFQSDPVSTTASGYSGSYCTKRLGRDRRWFSGSHSITLNLILSKSGPRLKSLRNIPVNCSNLLPMLKSALIRKIYRLHVSTQLISITLANAEPAGTIDYILIQPRIFSVPFLETVKHPPLPKLGFMYRHDMHLCRSDTYYQSIIPPPLSIDLMLGLFIDSHGDLTSVSVFSVISLNNLGPRNASSIHSPRAPINGIKVETKIQCGCNQATNHNLSRSINSRATGIFIYLTYIVRVRPFTDSLRISAKNDRLPAPNRFDDTHKLSRADDKSSRARNNEAFLLVGLTRHSADSTRNRIGSPRHSTLRAQLYSTLRARNRPDSTRTACVHAVTPLINPSRLGRAWNARGLDG